MVQTIFNVLLAVAALVAILDYFGLKPSRPFWGFAMPIGRNWKLIIMLGLVAASLGLSGYGLYRAMRPKVIEKIVEKPVDRIVEKVVQSKCPEPISPANKSTKQPARTSRLGSPTATTMVPSEDHSDVAGKLIDFMDEGSKYQQTFVENNDPSLIRQQESEWSVKVEAYLEANLSKLQASEFRNVRSNSAAYLINHNIEGGAIYNLISVKTQKLAEFAKELQANNIPPMSQECAPGANCAQSTGQQGGITAAQVNIDTRRHIAISDAQQLAIADAMKPFAGQSAFILANGDSEELVKFCKRFDAALDSAQVRSEFHTGTSMSEGNEASKILYVGYNDSTADMANAFMKAVHDNKILPLSDISYHHYDNSSQNVMQIIVSPPN